MPELRRLSARINRLDSWLLTHYQRLVDMLGSILYTVYIMKNIKQSESKVFDTSTLNGIQSAERYQSKLYSKYDRVIVSSGLNYARIEGMNRPTAPELK